MRAPEIACEVITLVFKVALGVSILLTLALLLTGCCTYPQQVKRDVAQLRTLLDGAERAIGRGYSSRAIEQETLLNAWPIARRLDAELNGPMKPAVWEEDPSP